MLDLLITHANLPDGRQNMSIAVQGGRIAEVTEACKPQRTKLWTQAACW